MGSPYCQSSSWSSSTSCTKGGGTSSLRREGGAVDRWIRAAPVGGRRGRHRRRGGLAPFRAGVDLRRRGVGRHLGDDHGLPRGRRGHAVRLLLPRSLPVLTCKKT